MRLFLLLVLLASPAPAGSPVSHTYPAARPSPAPLTPEELFSRRALRRARLLIQMRVLQFREERLDCIRAALRRRLPDSLWPEEPTPSRGTPDARTAVARCEDVRLAW
ncbi:MAG TPA: hypothetical protein VKR56_04395 [Candidatus Cybelea sp.]|nr:hypothetical protein [Candidatus Cybelea sp.]